jgi:hypothetical protein
MKWFARVYSPPVLRGANSSQDGFVDACARYGSSHGDRAQAHYEALAGDRAYFNSTDPVAIVPLVFTSK